ncbi:MAG: carbohydrate transporter substrate-binding protein [Rhodoglobus sp.]|nr:carbohydrate transporter substrate-binding protein [Rhodoglobus sp.]
MHRNIRNKSRRRAIAGIAVLGVAVASLVGCAAGPTTTDEGSATSGDLTWWGWSPQPGPAEEFLTAFNKEYPDIHITYKNLTLDGWDAALRPALASPNGPDLFGISPGPKVANYGEQAVDITPALEESLGKDWKSKVSALVSVPQMYTESGKLVGAGVGSANGGSMWINKDLFDKYDLTPPTTMDEWLDDCEVFKANGVTCFVQGAAQAAFDRDHLQAIADNLKPGVWQAASEGKAKWTDPVIVEALTIWKSLFTKGVMQEGAVGAMHFPDANNAFFSGNVAMIMMGTWYMQYATIKGMTAAMTAAGIADPKPFVTIPIPYPSVNGKPSTDYHLFGDVDYAVAVNSKSPNVAAATTFAIWLGTSEAGQQLIANTGGSVASLKSAQPIWDEIPLVDPDVQVGPISDLIKAAGTITEPRLGILTQDMTNAVGIAATTVGAGEATPEEAAKTLQATFDQFG